ncbi:MAG: hypothetical protein Q9227_000138 [Pyrenula ochraceoflavens]
MYAQRALSNIKSSSDANGDTMLAKSASSRTAATARQSWPVSSTTFQWRRDSEPTVITVTAAPSFSTKSRVSKEPSEYTAGRVSCSACQPAAAISASCPDLIHPGPNGNSNVFIEPVNLWATFVHANYVQPTAELTNFLFYETAFRQSYIATAAASTSFLAPPAPTPASHT